MNRVPLWSCLLRMLRNGGMDYTREAPGGCCPAALYYDRKVRSPKKRTTGEPQQPPGSSLAWCPVPRFCLVPQGSSVAWCPVLRVCVVDFFPRVVSQIFPFTETVSVNELTAASITTQDGSENSVNSKKKATSHFMSSFILLCTSCLWVSFERWRVR